MAKDAYYFLIPLLLLALVLLWLEFFWLGVLCFVLAGFVAFFFRDPERSIPEDPRAVVSPADGRVVRLKREKEHLILSIFLSIFDVHINRSPITGRIVKKLYEPGKFRVAFDDRASVENERMTLTIRGERSLTFSLIAGIVARRIRVWRKEGEQVNKGDKIGLIRFGSRVDIILPPECDPVVRERQKVYGGTTIIAYWND